MRFIYIAGPMSKGSLMDHVREAIEVATIVADNGGVPFLPQLSVLWHLHEPRNYESWLELDFAIIERFDCLLRLPGESSGAEREIEHAKKHGKPVFFDIEDYLAALRSWKEQQPIVLAIADPIPCTRAYCVHPAVFQTHVEANGDELTFYWCEKHAENRPNLERLKIEPLTMGDDE